MYANAVILSDEAVWVTVVLKDVGFAVVAGCADVVWPCDVARPSQGGPGTMVDSCGSHVFWAAVKFSTYQPYGWTQIMPSCYLSHP
jgi:hypothetical protein